MAEIVRPKTSVKPSVNKIEHEKTTTQIDDANLEKRLKSLRSFINNLEPSEKQEELKSEKEEERKNEEDSSSTENIQKETRLVEEVKSIEASAPVFSQDIIKPQTLQVLKPIQNESQPCQINLEQIHTVNKLDYPRLNWNNQINKAEEIDEELEKSFERDQVNRELVVYYKCKLVECQNFGKLLDEFIVAHSSLNEFRYDKGGNVAQQRRNEFFELVRDYFEARSLVRKCNKRVTEFKHRCHSDQMKKRIWSFEKYTIESSGICGDNQTVRQFYINNKINYLV